MIIRQHRLTHIDIHKATKHVRDYATFACIEDHYWAHKIILLTVGEFFNVGKTIFETSQSMLLLQLMIFTHIRFFKAFKQINKVF